MHATDRGAPRPLRFEGGRQEQVQTSSSKTLIQALAALNSAPPHLLKEVAIAETTAAYEQADELRQQLQAKASIPKDLVSSPLTVDTPSTPATTFPGRASWQVGPVVYTVTETWHGGQDYAPEGSSRVIKTVGSLVEAKKTLRQQLDYRCTHWDCSAADFCTTEDIYRYFWACREYKVREARNLSEEEEGRFQTDFASFMAGEDGAEAQFVSPDMKRHTVIYGRYAIDTGHDFPREGFLADHIEWHEHWGETEGFVNIRWGWRARRYVVFEERTLKYSCVL